MTIISQAPQKPSNYGDWWNKNEHNEDWYNEIFEHRPNSHKYFMDWFSGLIRKGEQINRLLEVGCGRAIPYATYFKTVSYHGTDISKKEIDFCKNKYNLPDNCFFVSDVIQQPAPERYDLVFSHAVIDHVYDINAFLRSLASCSDKYVYISAYRSWKPDLKQHFYYWSEPVTCFHNDVSPAEARLVLREIGFSRVEIFPVFSGRWDIGYPMETVIIAERD